LAFDDALAAHGVPPLTQWWRDGIGRWLDAYEQSRVLELWACVGRGAAKSTALYKLALFFAVFGAFEVPPGERHYAIVLSRLKEEAAKGIAIIGRWLTLLGIGHHPTGDVIELDDLPRGIRVVAASVAAASGWRAFFVGKDERSKWPMGGIEALEAAEIDTSAAAMTATHATAPVLSFGSAWGAFGEFYDGVVGGSDSHRHVLGPTPTWIAAPHVTEESTRRRERDRRRWAREYLCEFQAGALSAFDVEGVDQAMALTVPDDHEQCGRVLLLDPTAGASDTYAYCVAGWRRAPDGKRLLELSNVAGIDRARDRGFTSDRMVRQIAAVARAHECSAVHADQFEQFALASAFGREGLRYVVHSWTAPLKERAVEHTRMWLRDGLLVLPKHDRLRRELLAFEERLAPSGALTFRGRGSHDDFAMLLMLGALVDVEGGLFDSPTGKPVAWGGLLSYYQQEAAIANREVPLPTKVDELVPLVAPRRSSRPRPSCPAEVRRIRSSTAACPSSPTTPMTSANWVSSPHDPHPTPKQRKQGIFHVVPIRCKRNCRPRCPRRRRCRPRDKTSGRNRIRACGRSGTGRLSSGDSGQGRDGRDKAMTPTTNSTARHELADLKAAIAEKVAESEKIQSLIAEIQAQCAEPPSQDELSTLRAQKAEAAVAWAARRLAGEDAPLPPVVSAPTASIASAQRERLESHKQLVEALAPALATLRERLDACSISLKTLKWQQLALVSRFVAESAAALVPELETSVKQPRLLAARILAARAWLVERQQTDLLHGLPSAEVIEAMMLPLPGQVEMERQTERKGWWEFAARLCADPDEQAAPALQAAE
jgi:hypothetical protein